LRFSLRQHLIHHPQAGIVVHHQPMRDFRTGPVAACAQAVIVDIANADAGAEYCAVQVGHGGQVTDLGSFEQTHARMCDAPAGPAHRMNEYCEYWLT
jgi:hypothetical protein